MTLSRKVRAFARLSRVLTAVHVLPDAEKAATLPLAKRTAIASPAWAIDKAPADVATHDASLPGGQRMRLYRTPADHPQPVLIYLHGGGFTVGGLMSCDHICARIAHDSGAAVLSVEYRLAPEHAYPAALEDTEDALAWVAQHASELGLDDQQIAVGGDSAGGNLAAGFALRCREKGLPLRAQLLIYPALDATQSTPSARTCDAPGLSVKDLALCWKIYAGSADGTNPEISPLLADDLSGLPPALVITAAHDPLHDEGVAYAVRLLEAGVPTEAVDYPDYLHAFLSLPKLYVGVDDCWQRISAFLRTHLTVTAQA